VLEGAPKLLVSSVPHCDGLAFLAIRSTGKEALLESFLEVGEESGSTTQWIQVHIHPTPPCTHLISFTIFPSECTAIHIGSDYFYFPSFKNNSLGINFASFQKHNFQGSKKMWQIKKKTRYPSDVYLLPFFLQKNESTF